MNKKIIILVLVLFIIGCKGKSGSEPMENYRVGTEGLELELVGGLPAKLYAGGGEIEAMLEVKNVGAFPISTVDRISFDTPKLHIGGTDIRLLSVVSDPSPPTFANLDGKSQLNPKGGREFVTIKLNPIMLSGGTPVYNPTVIFALEYIYRTVASPIVCVDPNPLDTKVKEKACTVSPISLNSQGAPVAVKRVEMDVTNTHYLFKIYVENVGDGNVVKISAVDGTAEDPLKGYSLNSLNVIEIDSILIDVGGLTSMESCKPTNLRLIDGKGQFFCSVAKSSFTATSAFESPLNIWLNYGYTTSIKSKVKMLENPSVGP